MGMFDDVTVRYPLPLPEDQSLDFQTKSLDDPCLNHYQISESGELSMIHECGVGRVDPPRPVNFTGEIEVHSFHGALAQARWVSWEFVFVAGHVTGLAMGVEHWRRVPAHA